MFQIKPYADKPSAFGLSVHSFGSFERIGKWEEDRYRKGGRKPYFIELGGTPRWINLKNSDPSHDTIQRVMGMIRPENLQQRYLK